MRVDVRRGEVVRHLARDEYEVNDAWLCDKGRYAFRFPDSPERITTPLIRDHGLEPASFGEVLTKIASWVDGARVGVLTGGRLMDEDYYALSKLARTVFKTNDLDHRRGSGGAGGGAASPARAPMGVTYRDVERAKVILVVGLDAEQEVPDPAPPAPEGRGRGRADLWCCTRAARGCTTWRAHPVPSRRRGSPARAATARTR